MNEHYIIIVIFLNKWVAFSSRGMEKFVWRNVGSMFAQVMQFT